MRGERVVVEPEALHGPGREVLGDGVGPLVDEAPHERDRVGVLEVQRDVALPDVQRVVHRRALEAVRVVGPERVDPEEVRAAPRLDPQHRGAVLDEVAGRDRAGGARAELEDVAPRSTPPAAAVARRGRSRRVRADQARRPGRRRRGRGPVGRDRRDRAVGVAGLHERRREALDVAERREEAPGGELRARQDLRGRVRRRQHQVGVARDVVELLHRATGEVLGDRAPRWRAALPRRRCSATTSTSPGPRARRRRRRPRRRGG